MPNHAAPPPIGGALSCLPSTSGRPFASERAHTGVTFATHPSVALAPVPRRQGRRPSPAPLVASLTLADAPARVLDALDRVARRAQGVIVGRGGKNKAPPPPPPFSLPPVAARAARYARHLAAGASSCAVTRTVLAPLERVKLEQVLRSRPGGAPSAAARGFRATVVSLYTQGGLAAFWQGNGVNLMRTCPHKAVNFFAFDTFRRALLARPRRVAAAPDDFGTGERFAAGALAGMTATALCFPLDVLRTRIMAGGGPAAAGGVVHAARALVAAEGVRGLYVGLAPALVATAPSGAIFYGTYDVVKEAYLRAIAAKNGGVRPRRLGPRETLAFGAVAGAAAELTIYPAEVVRRRMQLEAAAAAGAIRRAAAAGGGVALTAARHTFRSAATALLAERGVAGLYAGLGANMLQVLPSAALSYYAYEVFKSVLAVDEEKDGK